jgi:predicted transcriptional regulator of viral defense system
MNNISLTQEEVEMLETALIQFGSVVSFDQLSSLIEEDRAYTRKRIQKLTRQGWLTRIKKGLYVISDLSSRGSLSISHLAIVNHLAEDAYISFESALQYHGLFDQLLATITAVSQSQHTDRVIGGFTYAFVKTSAKYFYGWEQHQIDGQVVKIAQAEKALIDLLQFHRSVYTTDLVLEILRNHSEAIDSGRLVDFGMRANLTTRRILGFLLDLSNMDSTELLTSVQSAGGVSYISQSDKNLYNHKWKLYYDPFFNQ